MKPRNNTRMTAIAIEKKKSVVFDPTRLNKTHRIDGPAAIPKQTVPSDSA